MKTLIRTLIILAVFITLSGAMIVAVNASGANAPDFDGEPRFRPDGGEEFRQPEGGEFRPERGDREERGGPRWMFGLIKNVGVISVLVVAITLPRSFAKKKKKQDGIKASAGE